MADSKYISIQQDEDMVNGTVKISPRVLEIISSIAAQEVDGVYAMRDSISNTFNSLFNRNNHGKGVTIDQNDDSLTADIYAYFDYGVAVPTVSLNLQKALREQMNFMTDLNLTDINVHVVGLVAKKEDGNIEVVKVSE